VYCNVSGGLVIVEVLVVWRIAGWEKVNVGQGKEFVTRRWEGHQERDLCARRSDTPTPSSGLPVTGQSRETAGKNPSA
jgi:hypothetical protein